MSDIREGLIAAIVAAFPVALVFFSGWAYLTSYLGLFGVDATQINIPLTTVLVYAFAPLNTFSVVVLVSIILLVIGPIYRIPVFRHISLAFAFLAIFSLMWVVKWVAASEAQEMAELVWHGDKSQSVPVVSSSESQNDPSYTKFLKCRDERRLRQIIGLPDQLYVLCRNADLPCHLGTMFVFTASGVILYTSIQAHKPDEESPCE